MLGHRARKHTHIATCIPTHIHIDHVCTHTYRTHTHTQEFFEQPQAWRKRIQPLIVPPGGKRSKGARDSVRDYKPTEVIKRRYRLSMRHYISYKGFWDNLAPEDAERLFLEELEAQQSDQLGSDGEPTVTVKGIAFEQTIEGNGRRTSGSGGPAQDWEAGSVAASAPGSTRKRPRSPSPADDPRQSQRGGEGRQSSQTPHSKRADSTPKAPPPKRLMSEIIVAAGPTIPTANERKGENRHVIILKARSDLGRDIKSLLEEVSGSKAPFSLLQKRLKDLSADSTSFLDVDPAKVLSDFQDNIMKPLRALESAQPSCSSRRWRRTGCHGAGYPAHMATSLTFLRASGNDLSV